MNGRNIVAAAYTEVNERSLKAVSPATELVLEGDFFKSNVQTVADALSAATAAFQTYRNIGKDVKAAFLNAIADEISAIGELVVNRAAAESGLSLGRLQGELGRTTGQLRLFANKVTEGSWVDAIIDTAQPDRVPIPKPDIRRMLVPLGPVAVFGASNFPLAFSVAGGDTASALAAGCPVVVKVHPAHYGTSALIGAAIIKAIEKTGVPKGVFSLLYDDEHTIGACLVQHSLTKAVAFTGSFQGGMALIDLARQRKHPIPVFAEMGSINPVIFLPQKLENDAEVLAKKMAASITLGAGQFCTNPGLMLAVKSPALERFKQVLKETISSAPAETMLSKGIAVNYQKRCAEMFHTNGMELLVASEAKQTALQNQSQAIIAQVSAKDFISNAAFREEVFGPYSLLVVAEDNSELELAIGTLEGQLTVTLMAERNELNDYRMLINTLEEKTGRIILNGVPTGVEVCAAMQHGGPFPATSDARFTSVGTEAIYRFVRPLAYQDWSQELLPDELKVGNPLNIFRTVNQKLTKEHE